MLIIATINGRSIDHVSLALAFAEELLMEIGETNVKTVVERNRTYSDDCCASHDFCDANMVMLAAANKLAGLHDTVDELPYPEHVSEEAFDKLWNAAWGLAKEAGFSTNIGTVANCYACR